MLLMIAITLKGGKGVDVDVNCTAPIKIFDPFGFRCYAYIGEHRLHISPAFIAATKNSKVAWKIVEQIADTWKEQRETASEPGQLNTIESQRVKINSVLEISYEPLLVMQKEYGPRFDRLFTSPADSLVLSITTDVINLPSSRLLDGPPEAPSLRRRASTPGMAAGRVGFEVIFGSSAHTLIDTLPASSALKRKYESEGFDVSEYQNRKFSSVSSEVTNLIKDKIAKNNLSIVWADCGAKMKDVTPVGYLDDSRETIILVRYPANADDSKSQRASVTLVPRKLLTSIESEETDKLIEENKSHLAKPSKMIKTTITFKTIQQLDSGEEPVKKMKKTKEVEAPIASSSKRKR